MAAATEAKVSPSTDVRRPLYSPYFQPNKPPEYLEYLASLQRPQGDTENTVQERPKYEPLLSSEEYRTPPAVVEWILLGFADFHFRQKDQSEEATTVVRIARPDYQVIVTDELPAVVRAPGKPVSLAAPGVYENEEWIVPSNAKEQIRKS